MILNRFSPSLLLLALVLALVGLGACEKAPPETLFTGSYDESQMDEAMAEARAKWDHFVTAFEAGDADDYSVKVAIEDGEEVEHFWAVDLKYENGKFEGMIGNEPGLVSNIAYGDRVTIDPETLSDWLFVKDDQMHGNYTLRVMMATMDPEEAKLWQAQLAPLPE